MGDLDVRACLGVSHHILPPPLQQLMCDLAQPDTPTLPAWTVMAIRETATPATSMLDRLVETSLLQPASNAPGITGYQMHDLVRLYHREADHACANHPAGHPALRRVIGGWLTLARVATDMAPIRHILDREPASPWSPPRAVTATATTDPHGWLATNLPNLAAAARQAARKRWPELAWPLVHRMSGHLFTTGQVDLLSELLTVALATATATAAGDTAGRACLLRLDAQLSELVDHTDRAVRSATEAARLYRLLGDERGRADCHTTLAFIAFDRGDIEQAQRLFTEVQRTGSTLDEPHLLARAYLGLGHCARELGDLHSAQQLMQHGVDAAQHGDPLVLAGLLRSLGATQRAAGDLTTAHASLLTALDLFHTLGDPRRTAYAQTMLADVLCDTGDLTTAQQLTETALPNLIAVADRGGIARVHSTLASIAVARHDHTTARHHLHTALAAWEQLDIPRLARQTRARLAQLDQPQHGGPS